MVTTILLYCSNIANCWFENFYYDLVRAQNVREHFHNSITHFEARVVNKNLGRFEK